MKRSFALIVLFTVGVAMSSAQSVREARLNVLDSDRMAFSVEFGFEEKILKDAWDKKCGDLKIKSKSQKGVDVFSAVLVPDIHYETIDMYTKIDKLDKTRSSIILTVALGNTNFVTGDNAKLKENIQRFLDGFITYAEQYKLQLDIADQENQIKDTQKKYDKMVDDGKKLSEQLEQNKVDQENMAKELEALNKALEDLKMKVKR